ncbi:putative lipoprotein [Turicibacter sp. HGF1]|uniref:hypothetical protein n=1 Tax=Turicibacter sp. HGF1 TaxID=910310 RepID=UPI0001FDA4DB|nr:hypothetical protein [Turicibacter sp. HGF1]EGC91899.1 putative lipoprotein [Turicibacter sp. HGF1]
MKRISILFCLILLITGCGKNNDMSELEDRIQQLEQQLAEKEDIEDTVLEIKTYSGEEVSDIIQNELQNKTFNEFMVSSLTLVSGDTIRDAGYFLGYDELSEYFISVGEDVFYDIIEKYNNESITEIKELTFKFNDELNSYEVYLTNGNKMGYLVENNRIQNSELLNILSTENINVSGVKADCFDCTDRELEYYEQTGEYLIINDYRSFDEESYNIAIKTEVFDYIEQPIMTVGVIEYIIPDEENSNNYTAILYLDPFGGDYPYSISLKVNKPFPQLLVGDMVEVYVVPYEVIVPESEGFLAGELEYFRFIEEYELKMWLE